MLYEKKKKDTFVAENAGNPLGEMLEWLKRHAWKACIRQKCIAGSNPAGGTNFKMCEPVRVTIARVRSFLTLHEEDSMPLR